MSEAMEKVIDEAVDELAPLVGVRAACRATGRPQANHYRRHRKSPKPPRPVREPVPQPRALSPAERHQVRALLNSPEHVDKAPATVYHELLDQGIYVCSVSTMYRVLREHGEVRERRRQATHPARVKLELVATGPNVCCSWDITKLLGPVKWTYYYLYVVLDIYSRYVVGWTMAPTESRQLAEQLLATSIAEPEEVAGGDPGVVANSRRRARTPLTNSQMDAIRTARVNQGSGKVVTVSGLTGLA